MFRLTSLVPIPAKPALVAIVWCGGFAMELASQTSPLAVPPLAPRQIYRKADTLRSAKAYASAVLLYTQAAPVGEFKRFISDTYYAAAYTYALAGDKDSAFKYLNVAFDAGWNNRQHLLTDSDLDSLHQDPRWRVAVSRNTDPKPAGTDPATAPFVTSDIRNFWNAYDMAEKDPANRLAIYKREYIDRGSVGLQDYFYFKVSSVKAFVDGHDRRPRFYAAIRKNTLSIDDRISQFRESLVKLKAIYPGATFPNTYFLIGSFSSGGTTSDHGLLLGIDQGVRTPDIPVDELTLWEQNNFTPIERIPRLIAHELVHFQQDSLRRERTLLCAALVEGMADFIGELISGATANPRIHQFARGKERQILMDFAKEMFDDRARNWIANSDQETADKPADLGYWVGYVISKGYYNRAADKNQAVWDMLHIKDYRAFLKASGVEELQGT
ncbi:MAG TPA: DUF2268 domain-containing putative Zn-dependent protease [Gemmatimonadaceae bacterium]|nr:DUF2268 domain-containing putative Zn-dependent protease [Gemmatimonadaceae bacterium]